MDEIITADQARELALANRRPLSYTFRAIKGMAEGGNNYATFQLRLVLDADAQKAELEKAGFKVEISDTHFSVNW